MCLSATQIKVYEKTKVSIKYIVGLIMILVILRKRLLVIGHSITKKKGKMFNH